MALERPDNYFETMGLRNTQVSEKEIQTRYQELSYKYNPANNVDPENIPRFKKIQTAYDCLNTYACKV